jgi:Ca2+/H+ antiporter, TMEM165/GDT1 family
MHMSELAAGGTTIFLMTYMAVLGAEIGGDKLLYTIAVLGGRFNRLWIAGGMGAAFVAKMGIAVAFGAAIRRVPAPALIAMTGASFIGVAWRVWRHPREGHHPGRQPSSASTALLLSFVAVVFSEWADVGQITAATMAARFGAPLIVLSAAVLAMTTKGLLAITIGGRLMSWVAGSMCETTLRYASVGLLAVVGVLSMMEALTR